MKALGLSRAILKREIIIDGTSAKIFTLFSFIILTALGAYVRIPLPFTPVPITLQTFFVLLAGAVLGRRLGMISQFGYVFLGTMGLPIFAGATSGLSVLFGATCGYFVGFILASGLVGKIVSHYKTAKLSQILIAMLLGSLLIDLMGCLWLKVLLRISWKKILVLGLWPFLPGDITKSIVAASLYQKIQRRTREIFFPE